MFEFEGKMADRHITSCYENAELGYVKIFRSMLNWEWYKNPYVTRVFLHFLLCATSKNYCKNANVLKQGSFWTTRRHVARALDISEYQVRKAIKKLVSTNEIACRSTPYGTYISIVNWNFYQCEALAVTEKRRDDGWSL